MEYLIKAGDDRRTVAAILADNGYAVRVEEREDPEYPSSRIQLILVVNTSF